MFNNIGKKIKDLAKAGCWIGIITSVLAGIIILMISVDAYDSDALVLGGILLMIFGSIFSWIGSFITYGFGELVENSCIQTELMVKKEMENVETTDEYFEF